MEGDTASSVNNTLQEPATASYTYWVRETTSDAAPLPLPKKLSQDDINKSHSQPPTLGSAWNKVRFLFYFK